jgi:RNA-directed DNA polymerase
MQTELLGIANKAKSEKKHRFRNLYGMLNEEFLTKCWKSINKKSATGVDKVSAEEYGARLTENIRDLVVQLKAKRYRARLVRRHYIPKGEGDLRPLGIPVTEDKLLQTAAAQILEAIYEQDFLPCSFGYRPGVGAHEALDCIRVKLQFGKYRYVVEADIKGYFNNIDHDWLMKMLEQRIDDKPFLRIIEKWLKAGVLDTDGEVAHPATGSPQGGVISPILANIYLHYVLDLWFEKVVKKHCRGEARLARYADDWICAFQYQEDAERFFRVVKHRLKKFGLELSPEKSHIIQFSRFHGSRAHFEFLGMEFRWGKDRSGKAYLHRRTAPKKFRKSVKAFTDWCRKSRHMPLSKFFGHVKSKLRGYYNYYGMPGNYEALGRFRYVTMKTLHKWLNRRSERRSYSWLGFNELLKHFQLPQPKVRPCSMKMYA